MGHQLIYGFCKKCKGMYGKRAGKQVFSSCKCKIIKERKQMEPNDFYQLNKILNDRGCIVYLGDQYEYWKKRINERIVYLTPLMDELKQKGLSLATLSKELHQEWIELLEVKEYYKF
jgi:hypothetical protein